MNYIIFLKTVLLMCFWIGAPALNAVELILSGDEYIEKAVFQGHMNAVSAVANASLRQSRLPEKVR